MQFNFFTENVFLKEYLKIRSMKKEDRRKSWTVWWKYTIQDSHHPSEGLR